MNKKVRIINIISTGLFSLMMAASATMYFVSPEVAQNFVKLGFPDYFRIELGIAKYLGVLALVIPVVPARIKEWAYAGFGITVISAAIAHISIGDPVNTIVPPIMGFVILATSYISRQRLNK